jgi:Zn finger protein HypA/HybF involved in hydrogenase expression
MGKQTLTERRELVRCLDCGTEYRLPRDVQGEAEPCPACGSIAWVAVIACAAGAKKNS